MYVLPLSCPGTFLSLPDRGECRQAKQLFLIIESAFTDATLALNLFEFDQQIVEAHIMEDAGIVPSQSPSGCPTCIRRAMPKSLEQRLPFIHARTFLYALDTIGKALEVLANLSTVPDAVRSQRDAFRKALPTLTPLRNTAQHVEDRGRGLGKGMKPLDLKPIVNELFNVPGGGILAINGLIDNKYGSTIADGRYVEIEVSAATLEIVQDCLQAVINALPWRGPSQQFPC